MEKLSISLENASFYAYHGVFEQEQHVGNEFEVSIRVEIDLPETIKNDNLSDTISYVDLYNIASEEMQVKSKLIEHVAYRIVRNIKSKWSAISHGEVSIIKLSPPIDKFSGKAKVKIIF